MAELGEWAKSEPAAVAYLVRMTVERAPHRLAEAVDAAAQTKAGISALHQCAFEPAKSGKPAVALRIYDAIMESPPDGPPLLA